MISTFTTSIIALQNSPSSATTLSLIGILVLITLLLQKEIVVSAAAKTGR
jgi:hypothetical protein